MYKAKFLIKKNKIKKLNHTHEIALWYTHTQMENPVLLSHWECALIWVGRVTDGVRENALDLWPSPSAITPPHPIPNTPLLSAWSVWGALGCVCSSFKHLKSRNQSSDLTSGDHTGGALLNNNLRGLEGLEKVLVLLDVSLRWIWVNLRRCVWWDEMRWDEMSEQETLHLLHRPLHRFIKRTKHKARGFEHIWEAGLNKKNLLINYLYEMSPWCQLMETVLWWQMNRDLIYICDL